MAVKQPIITPAVSIRPLYFGSRWQVRSDGYQRFPLRFARLPMDLVRRHWLISTQIEQRFANHRHHWKVRLAIAPRREAEAAPASITHHRSRISISERSTFTREHFRSAALSNFLHLYRRQSVLRIERERAAIADMLTPAANRVSGPQPAAPPQRVLAPVIPAMAATALTRVERIQSVLAEPVRRQFVTRPAPPPAALSATGETSAAMRSPRAIRELHPDARPAMPPADLERLTDSLMRSIDRRLVASRERNGRT